MSQRTPARIPSSGGAALAMRSIEPRRLVVLGRERPFFGARLSSILLSSFLFSSILLSTPARSSPVVLSEIVASNDGGLRDADREASDWVELLAVESVDLDGWFLTDDPANLTRWRIPRIELVSGERLVVFASGKNRTDPAEELHTDFQLDADGEFLAIVEPDGMTIADAWSPTFPSQRTDVSFGVGESGGVDRPLLEVGATCRWIVPTSDAQSPAWVDFEFDDGGWNEGTTGLGYDRSGGALPDPDERVNLALAGTPEQSSDFAGSFGAERGNDGDFGNFTATASGDDDPWWRVDLGVAQPIALVVVHNRGDGCCQSRLRDITVEILDEDASIVFETDLLNAENILGGRTLDGPGELVVDVIERVGVPVEGRFVRVRRTPDPDLSGTDGAGNADEPNVLSIGEVEVYAGGSALGGLIATDVGDSMDSVSPSLFVRVPFDVVEPFAPGSTPVLLMRHDDGFVAYVDGVEVARRSAPGAPGTMPRWDDIATEMSAAPTVATAIDLTGAEDLFAPGIHVLAVHLLNVSADDPDAFVEPELVERRPAIGELGFFTRPTPGEPNGAPDFSGWVEDPVVDVGRGFYDAPIRVELSTATDDATILYTLGGSLPSANRGIEVDGTIEITETTVLRAVALRDGLAPSRVVTHSYIFVADVRSQPAMERSITGHAVYGPLLEDALLALPSVSVATVPSIPTSTEALASVELIFPDGTAGFHIDAGIKRVGGHSLGAYPKNNMRLYFRRQYGLSKLRYPLFAGTIYEDGARESFDRLTLRSGSHDSVFYLGDGQQPPSNAQYLRNRFMNDLQYEMGRPSLNGRFAHLYVNGRYHGQYQLLERPAPGHMADEMGGDKDDFEAVNRNSPVGGAAPAWSRIRAIRGDYDEVLRYVDTPNLVDYMLLNYWAGNAWDWRPAQNWMAGGPSDPDRGGYKFYCWDSDIVLRNLTDNNLGIGGPDNLFADLLRHEDFRVLVADRIHALFSDGGVLTPSRLREIYARRVDEIHLSIVAETARWQWRSSWTRDNQWERELDRLMESFFPRRTDVTLAQFASRRWPSSLEVPAFSRASSVVEPGASVALRAQFGEIWYTLDGTDPRAPGGVPAAGAQLAGVEAGAAERVLDAGAMASAFVPTDDTLGTRWTANEFDDATWTVGTTGVGFDRGDDFDQFIGLDVEEAMYQVATGVYVRVPFQLDSTKDLESKVISLLVRYDDGFIAYLNGERVASANAPDEPSADSAATATHADSAAVLFERFDISSFWSLLRRGDNLLAIHGLNRTTNSGDALVVPVIELADASGGGLTIERTTALTARIRSGDQWSPPEEAIYAIDASELRVTELQYHPAAPLGDSPFSDDDFEFLEITNVGGRTLSISGLSLQGGVELEFGYGGEVDDLPPGASVVVVSDLGAFRSRYGDEAASFVAGEYDGRLDNSGDEIHLTDALGETLVEFRFEDEWWPDSDGLGPSLEIRDARADPTRWNEADAWQVSTEVLGSPGRHDLGDGGGGLQRIGDINQDGELDISDPIGLLGFLFLGSRSTLPCAGDVTSPANRRVLDGNGDDAVNLSDAVFVLEYLFRGGPSPPGGTECVPVNGCDSVCVAP